MISDIDEMSVGNAHIVTDFVLVSLGGWVLLLLLIFR